MSSRLIWKDITRNKAVTLTTLLFVGVAAMLLSLSTTLGVNLFGSIDRLMRDARTPHFMQMHAGEPDIGRLEAFAVEYDGVDGFQAVTFLNIGGDKIVINGKSLAGGLQDNGFCTQSEQFDFLLDTDNNPAHPAEGELYAPVFYSKDNAIRHGDTVTVNGLTFTVAGFVRDSMMNSALASSKRFLISEADYARLEPYGGVEYLIEYRLDDLYDLGRFSSAYQAAGLPANGPTLTWPLFRMMSAISDGMMIAVVLIIGIIAILIALLCIRFTLLAKIEDDYREIGVMKALGMRAFEIRGLYLANYGATTAAGCVTGFALSLLLRESMMAGIRLNFGKGGNDGFTLLLGLASVFLMLLFVLLYVSVNLRCFRGISAVEALHFGMRSTATKAARLSKSNGISVNLFLGIQDVWARKRLYATMLAVVMLAAFIIIVPQNLYHTISAEDFVTYMGVGRCDLRIDIQQSGRPDERAIEIGKYMEADPDISKYTVLTTKTFGVKMDDGTTENVKVELGDHAAFPVQCVKGRMPATEQEIALSLINAEEWGKAIGDRINLLTADGDMTLTVCGIYSDITNGGKTAKAVFAADSMRTAWSIVCAALTDPGKIDSKRAEYADRFSFAKVSGIDDYVAETFGQTLRSVRTASLVSVLAAAVITLLVTLMFLKLLAAKDRHSIAVMKAMGFTNSDVRKQYMWRMVSVLVVGIALGTLLAGTLGEKLAAAAISSFGAAAFRFVVNIPATYLFTPLLMLTAALLATVAGTAAIGDIRISQSIKE